MKRYKRLGKINIKAISLEYVITFFSRWTFLIRYLDGGSSCVDKSRESFIQIRRLIWIFNKEMKSSFLQKLLYAQ